MINKKHIFAAIIAVVFTLIPALPANAAEASATPSVPAARICAYADCVESGMHYHGHNEYDISCQNTYCNTEGCTTEGIHEHDGISYGNCPQAEEAYCTGNSSCTVTGHNHSANHKTGSTRRHHGNGRHGGCH